VKYQEWQIWGKKPEQLATLADRAEGKLPEMESTKQLVKIISDIYQPNMQLLDVGCNTGHYLLGLHRLDSNINYTGSDAYESYINKAKEIFSNDNNVKFEVRDILSPNFSEEKYDLVFCCNVLLHLPDFRTAVKNLLSSTKKVCIIRTLLGTSTSIVKLAYTEEYDELGNPLNYCYLNTWKLEFVIDFIKKLGWNVEVIEDEFNPEILEKEYTEVKSGSGTRILNGKQVDSNIIFNWTWLKITK